VTGHPADSLRRRRQALILVGAIVAAYALVLCGLVVIAATVWWLRYDRPRVHAPIKSATVQMGLVRTALDLYQLTVGQYPTTDEGLDALRYQPPTVPKGVWSGPYLKDPVPLDPWGNPYQYVSPGRYNVDSYDLWSLGPDGRDGTADDVLGWIVE
jgi:type II secretion system protein G